MIQKKVISSFALLGVVLDIKKYAMVILMKHI